MNGDFTELLPSVSVNDPVRRSVHRTACNNV